MEEALRRRFVFYAALKSRFTAPFSAANNSGGGDDDNDNDADVDEQKERTKEKAAAAATERPLSVLAHPLKYLPLGAPRSSGFLPKAPSRFCPFPSFHMATGNFFTHKDIFVREKTQRERGGRRILGKALTWARKEKKKRKMESLKPATCVKTFRHSFVHAPFPPAPSLPPLLSRVLTPLRGVRHRTGRKEREGTG